MANNKDHVTLEQVVAQTTALLASDEAAKNAVIGQASDTKDSDTVKGAKAFATDAVDTAKTAVLGSDQDAAGTQTVAGANKAAAAASEAAGENATAIEGIKNGTAINDFAAAEAELEKKLESADLGDYAKTADIVGTDEDGVDANTIKGAKAYAANLVGSAGHLKREIVTALPDASAADKDTIYMVKDESVTGSDKYTEYMLIDGALTPIGDTSVDLTPYAKTEDLPGVTTNPDFVTAMAGAGLTVTLA